MFPLGPTGGPGCMGLEPGPRTGITGLEFEAEFGCGAGR